MTAHVLIGVTPDQLEAGIAVRVTAMRLEVDGRTTVYIRSSDIDQPVVPPEPSLHIHLPPGSVAQLFRASWRSWRSGGEPFVMYAPVPTQSMWCIHVAGDGHHDPPPAPAPWQNKKVTL